MFDYDTNNVACHWVSCDLCKAVSVMVNGNGRYFTLRVYQISLKEGEIQANNEIGKLLCDNCFRWISDVIVSRSEPQTQHVVVGQDSEHYF